MEKGLYAGGVNKMQHKTSKSYQKFAYQDTAEIIQQINKEIENFIIETVHQERKNYAVL